MAATSSAPSPIPGPQELGQMLASAEGVHRDILDETLDSAERGELLESGRTVCGELTDIRPPYRRSDRSVELERCPAEGSGIWHTHVTEPQLRNPEHSLPDWANVVFGGVDASMVVGIETSEVLVYGGEEMARAFLGAVEGYTTKNVDLETPAAVASALAAGAIPDPPAARREVRRRLSPLVTRIDTAYPQFETRLQASVPAEAPHDQLQEGTPEREGQFDSGVKSMPGTTASDIGQPDAGRTRTQSREIGQLAAQINSAAPVNMKEQAFGTALGTIVGYGVNNYFLDRLNG